MGLVVARVAADEETHAACIRRDLGRRALRRGTAVAAPDKQRREEESRESHLPSNVPQNPQHGPATDGRMGSMRKKRTLPKSLTGTTQMPDAPTLPAAPRKQSVPPAKGSPVAPPPMWNIEAKEGPRSPAPPPKPASPLGGTAAVDDQASAKAATDVAKAREDAEDTAALAETGAALDGLSEQLALLEALVARLPE